jgi:hypothetical protein
MFSVLSDGRINNALSLMVGHQRWVERNTGLTNDPHQDHYIQNPDGVLANNRHFIADTQMEYQPNGDGTTEGQSIHILGYLHAYLATNDPMYLDKAIWHWDMDRLAFCRTIPIRLILHLGISDKVAVIRQNPIRVLNIVIQMWIIR